MNDPAEQHQPPPKRRFSNLQLALLTALLPLFFYVAFFFAISNRGH